MLKTLGRGLAAGAAGVTALNATTYLDMLLSGRPGSDAPARLAQKALDRAGVDVPGGKHVRKSRQSALGSLAGVGAGVGVGVAASAVRRAGIRLPAPLGAVLAGAAAMAAENVPMAKLGVTDPRTWSTHEWVSDLAPHLAYGATVRAVLDATEPPGTPQMRRRARAGLLWRSAALGFAAGCRSSLGLVTPALAGGAGEHAVRATATAGLLGSELVLDKLPIAPSRMESVGLAARYGSGALGAFVLAHRDGSRPLLPLLTAAAGTTVGTAAGAAWREYAAEQGWGNRAAFVEDGVAIGLSALAARA